MPHFKVRDFSGFLGAACIRSAGRKGDLESLIQMMASALERRTVARLRSHRQPMPETVQRGPRGNLQATQKEEGHPFHNVIYCKPSNRPLRMSDASSPCNVGAMSPLAETRLASWPPLTLQTLSNHGKHIMPVTLDSPISWKTASGDNAAMLDQLQPNILKPHTRDFLVALFLQFTDEVGGRAFLRDVENHMKSAREHLVEVEKFKDDPSVPGTPYVGVGLTAPGYGALKIAQVPSDPSFNAGMRNGNLHDPDVSTWDPHFREREALHAVILIGDMTMDPVSTLHAAMLTKIEAAKGVVLLGTQEGRSLHNANGDGIEHFGYVDGRSQPLFFEEDIAAETLGQDGTSKWKAGFPLGQAIVEDPAAPNPNIHFGSYFIFRKLEQDVKKFKEEEAEFAKRLEVEFGNVQIPPAQKRLDADAFERAGALLVGRFEDGTPATLQSAPGAHNPVPNDFDYESDKAGAKCPFFGHIRKTNPRGDGGFEDPKVERGHLMPRRGQTYGVRVDNPNDGQTDNKPTKDVGLLFMAFNSDIAKQFEFMQESWANAPGFPKGKGAGVDPIIGQTKNDSARPRVTCPVVWGDAGKKSMVTVDAIPRTVTMKGGEYFFMPSLDFIRSL